MNKLVPLFVSVLLLLFSVAGAKPIPVGVPDKEIRAVAYSGEEILEYKISWTGGIQIGELRLEVKKSKDHPEQYEILARVKDSGLFHFFYPVDDTFVTVVEGENRLPLRYDVEQKEGSGYEARRHTEYDQAQGIVRYRKNDQDETTYQVEGEVHNEFSSFFFTRIIGLDKEQPVLVPTFADKKRNEVVVKTGERSHIKKTVVGDVNVIPVSPIMKFKGLYDKAGDTVIYLTDDMCRIPVRIRAKILIGSLTAELVSYSNPSCPDQSQYHSEIAVKKANIRKLELGD